MWTEQFTATVKTLKLSADGTSRIVDMVLDMGSFPAEFDYALPRGKDTYEDLMNGDFTKLSMSPDADAYQILVGLGLDMTPLRTIDGVRVVDVSLTRKEDKETGEIEVKAKLTLRWHWSDEELIFFAKSIGTSPGFEFVKQQTELFDSEKGVSN